MSGKKWADPEDAILKEHYTTCNSNQLAGMLSGRTPKAILHRLYKLGLSTSDAAYSERRDDFDRQLSERLGEPISDYLRRRYVDEEATYYELCTELGINQRTLMLRMKIYDIEPINHKTAGKRNYQKNKKMYDDNLGLKNSDQARQKSAQSIQERWETFASDQAKEIIYALNDLDLFPIPEYAIHRFNIDIAFPNAKLAVEVDGGNWHNTEKHLKLQEQKEKYLTKHGWAILRLKTPHDLDDNIDKVLSMLESLGVKPPTPSGS